MNDGLATAPEIAAVRSVTREFPHQSTHTAVKPEELDLLDISDQTSNCAPPYFWRILLELIKRKRARDSTNRDDER